MNSVRGTAAFPAVGFPIRTSPDQSLVSGSPTLFAATHVLLRLLSPRHPSCALRSLVISLPFIHLPSPRRPRSNAFTTLSAKRGCYFAPAFSLYTYLRICNCQRSSEENGADRDRTDDIQL